MLETYDRESGTYYEPSTSRVYQLLETGTYMLLVNLKTDTIYNDWKPTGLELKMEARE